MKNRIFHITFLLLSTITLCSCAKEEEPVLPYVKVDFSIPLSSYPGLLNGEVPLEYPNVGYKGNGVIIVPSGFGDEAKFKAFDATCTRDISEETTAVKWDKSNFTATCPTCKTVYNLLNGYAMNQNFHLQEYAVRRDGSNRIYITTY
jgi:hypothetical protein